MATKADEPEPTPTTAPVDDSTEPAWLTTFTGKADELIGALGGVNANVTDDDRKSIAEHVHGLFESSGAFQKPEPDDEPDDEPAGDEPPGDEPPQKKSLAERLGFPKW